MFKIIAMFVPIVFVAGAVVFDIIKSNINSETEVYPPTGNSAIEFQKYSGKFTTRGIAALILQLCREGVLKLSLTDDKLDILLIDEYKGFDQSKKSILNFMFSNNNEVCGIGDEIVAYPVYHLTEKSVSEDVTSEIIRNVKMSTKQNKSRINVPEKEQKRVAVWAAAEIIVVAILLVYPSMEKSLIALFMSLFVHRGIILAEAAISESNTPGFAFGCFWIVFVIYALINLAGIGSAPIIGEAVLSAAIFIFFMTGRKKDSVFDREKRIYKSFIKLLGKSKKNIEINEKFSRINPGRLYELLPYVCAVGKHKNWIEQHERLECDKPDWIVADKEFDYSVLEECVDKLVEGVKSH